jgi:hypothetical protein
MCFRTENTVIYAAGAVFNHLPRLVLLAAFFTAGCGTSGDAGPADARTEVPDESYSLTWGPLEVSPGVEDVRCVTKKLGNGIPVNINRIHNVLGAVSHHMIIYKSNDTVESPVPAPCNSIENLISEENGLPLMITQKAEEMLQLPTGVAFAMAADQMIRIELHYINASDEPKELLVTSTFIPIPDAELQHNADLLFVGDPDIDIAPMSQATLGPVYSVMPYELGGSKIFGITGHQHQWGVNVTVDLADTETGPFVSMYDLPDFNWNEPETVYYDPPMELVEGGGFRYQCDWDNQSDQRITFGEDVDDEMCFFWAYYYPSKGPRTCFHTTMTGAPLDVCCPGHQLCNVINDYF